MVIYSLLILMINELMVVVVVMVKVVLVSMAPAAEAEGVVIEVSGYQVLGWWQR